MASDELLTTVEFGSRVEVELIDERGQRESLSFTIVHEAAADMDRDLISEQAPLARSILAKAVGQVVPYRMGDVRAVHIVSARRAPIDAPADAHQRRQAVQKNAREKAERTNAEMFAASFSGKWGDYELGDEQS